MLFPALWFVRYVPCFLRQADAVFMNVSQFPSTTLLRLFSVFFCFFCNRTGSRIIRLLSSDRASIDLFVHAVIQSCCSHIACQAVSVFGRTVAFSVLFYDG